MICSPSIMYWFTISVWAWTCLSFHTTRPINLMCRGGLWAIIYKKRTPESFHVSTTYCAADYFLFCYIHKRYSFSHCIQKVSFGQPARQESDKNCHNTLENHSISRDSCFQGVFFQQHNGIAKVQPCKPIQRSLGAKPRLTVGTLLTLEALDQWDFWLLIFGFNW